MPTANFKVEEMLHKRTPNSKTWMNFDGSYTTEIHSGVVHFKDQHGNLQNINTDLYDEADFDLIDEPVEAEGVERFKQAKTEAKAAKKQNVLNRAQHNFQALRVPFDAHIPRNFQRGYTIGKGQDKLTFKPVKSSPSMGELSQTDRSTIVYQDVWNDTDVELQVQANGLKETIHLKTSKAPTSFSFEVKGKDIADDFTAGALKLMPAWLVDAAGTERDVEQVIVRGNDNKMYVELKADVTDLIYPIAIDPTVTVQPGLAAMKDTYIQSNDPSINKDGNMYLMQTLNDTGFANSRILIQPDLSFIPAGSAITSFNINLYLVGSGNNAYLRRGSIYPIASEWEEKAANWSNMVNNYVTTAKSLYSFINTTNNTYLNFDIKDIAQKWLDGTLPNNGVMFIQEEGTWMRFYSNDYATSPYGSTQPKLEVTYNVPPTAPIVTSPNGGESWNSLHTVAWESGKDPHTEVIFDQNGGSAMLSSSTTKVAQTFSIDADFDIVHIDFLARNVSGNVNVELWTTNGTIPLSLLTSVTHNVQANAWNKVYLPKEKLQAATVYAVVFSRITADIDFATTSSNPYPKGSVFLYGSSWSTVAAFDLALKIEVIKAVPLQHQIQLSTDNGATWATIVGLTDMGVTSYPYDFINQPESSTAKIRIRAYDGASYGPWDESNGVFTIVHNQAPSAPMNLLPSGGQPRDRAQSIRLSWLHNDPDAGDPQSKYDLQWRKQGTTAWTNITIVTTNQYHDLSGLTYGNHEWRVRTYDQAGLPSPYSDIALFLAGDKPSKATITNYAEGATVAVANPTVQWSSADQAAYKLNVKDAAGVIVWTDEKVSTNKAVTANTNLANQQAYTLELSIRNADGLWSDVTAISVNVSYTPPAIPVLSISGDNQQAVIQLTIANPVPSGTEPSATHHDIYRRKQGDIAWDRIMTGAPANGSYVDATPGSGQIYEYYVRAWGDNGTYRDSPNVGSSITLRSVWLMDPQEPASLHHFPYFEPGRSAERIIQGAMMEFEGRTQPMAEFSEREQNKVNVVLQLKKDSDDLAALHDLLGRRTTLLYRDAKGRRIFGAIFVLNENETDYGYTVPLEVQAVNYKEEV